MSCANNDPPRIGSCFSVGQCKLNKAQHQKRDSIQIQATYEFGVHQATFRNFFVLSKRSHSRGLFRYLETTENHQFTYKNNDTITQLGG